ncbi:MAG: class I tRNA ligase family protein [Candidatus Niyogibacteria bacterium]|nr:class I tRNA ligase family protein [Candidatus Niyogibacteria bacterium]
MSEEEKSGKNKWGEEEVLRFWQENRIFERSLEKAAPRGDFVFYDGPPFATGLPHYGHILQSILKDAVPRYRTMKGYRVPRRWGWDCHGLPVENLIEKDLGLEHKKDIEKFGIAKFNEAAKKSVLRYSDDWKKIIPRVGRFVDMESDYKTMDATYTESVWWVFKTLYDKGLIYEGYKPMHICPRCETTLANFEVAQGYKDITDLSVTVKFKLEAGQKIGDFTTDENTYILAWTTTPWTLPGNVALAINNEIVYCKLKIKNEKLKIPEFYIFAKERIAEVLKDEPYEIISEFKGSNLVGKKYQPIFSAQGGPASDREETDKWENAYKIYGADFVTTEEGAGVVHIAPAFGEDDMNLGQKENLPFIQHVSMDGKFKPEVTDFAGMYVKPKSEDEKERLSADIAVIKYLQEHGNFFDKKKITHSYPHCWRCDTPLLNYAASSWFVKVTSIKDGKGGLLDNNQKINWVPGHIKDGRFGKWLTGARDWAISRSRFWGAPLPVWRCGKCEAVKVLGSREDLRASSALSGNKYFVMRHGESENNVKNIVNSNIENNHYALTEKGRAEAKKSAAALKGKGVNLIIHSDFRRTQETAEIVAKELGVAQNAVIADPRAREYNVGIFDRQDAANYHKYFSSREEKFYKNPPEGENLTELKNRMAGFLYDIDKKYRGKNILIVSHEYPIWMLSAGAEGADTPRSLAMKEDKDNFIHYAEVQALDFYPLPHNANFELDFHRPYIDEIKLPCSCGGEVSRVPEVFDCWFESGSMPYGQIHYPFENKELFEKNFPAEFIAEAVDQTRGWFYNLLVLSTALFGKPAFKNVITSGIILAEDGQKMSKRLKNYPDPMEVVEKYGADALRLYLLSSPVVRAESLNFSEKGVDEINKKIILRLTNVYNFYEMYAPEGVYTDLEAKPPKSENMLDKWIVARLKEVLSEVSASMDSYELDRAVRPVGEFVDDLSTWYLRRSRERFKEEGEDKASAVATTRYVFLQFAKLTAPFAPFVSEKIYQLLGGDKESVHLEDYPELPRPDEAEMALVRFMQEVRRLVSLGLEARAKAGIKVRQPLAALKLKTKNQNLEPDEKLARLLKDELNVKEIIFDESIVGDVELDLVISQELKEEGMLRELARKIQDMRKNMNLLPQDKVDLAFVAEGEARSLLEKYKNDLMVAVSAREINLNAIPEDFFKEELALDYGVVTIGIKK